MTPSSSSPSRSGFNALVVDDDPGIRQSIRLCLEAAGGQALGVSSPAAAMSALERGSFDVVLLDLWLGSESGIDLIEPIRSASPRAGIVVITAFATFDSAVSALRLGAVDYLPKPFSPEQVRVAVRRAMAEGGGPEAGASRAASAPVPLFATRSPAERALLETATRVAGSDCTVLLRGESGTGKNVLARLLHDESPRKAASFVTVHCPALTGELMQSALFGHRRGAFTGATHESLGKVQAAEGGTLFFDEVGDLGLDAQSLLLRFLNDKSYDRVGSPREERADVRIVAATNRPLERLVEEGRFREDLFFRLSVVTLVLPPLRDRDGDALGFARHWLRVFAERRGRPLELSAAAERAIEAHPWPGNLRELENAIERASVLGRGPKIEPADLGLVSHRAGAAAPRVGLGDDVTLEALEREHVARVIARAPSLEAAARTLGIDATTLSRKRKRYGLA